MDDKEIIKKITKELKGMIAVSKWDHGTVSYLDLEQLLDDIKRWKEKQSKDG